MRVAVSTFFGALPRLDRNLTFELRDPDVKKFELEARTPRVMALNRIDDRCRCENKDCRVRLMCDRVALRKAAAV
jgi:hypothetical protein